MKGQKIKTRNVVTEVTPVDVHVDNEKKQKLHIDYKTLSCTLDNIFKNIYAVFFLLVTIFFMTFIAFEL